EASKTLTERQVIKKIRDIVTFSRVEKVIRLCLTVLKNFLGNKGLCEDIVEENLLEAVQQLEFEKWRDAELYDDIREMATLISTEVNEMSNFERYERELQTGKLQWGFIHSSKFWAENALKFESNDFRALKVLAGLLLSPLTDPTTLAVICHDLGEFVTLHPFGKKKVAQLQVKERVMELMGTTEASYREVRREALLCCQKIMLNKWQAEERRLKLEALHSAEQREQLRATWRSRRDPSEVVEHFSLEEDGCAAPSPEECELDAMYDFSRFIPQPNLDRDQPDAEVSDDAEESRLVARRRQCRRRRGDVQKQWKLYSRS
ncbi:unnamed protein product, partial [Polarella glacialis]